MKLLVILNYPPYGTEHCYNALRLVTALLRNDPDGQVTIFLMSDAIMAAKVGQNPPQGYYNAEEMLARVIKGKGQVLTCGTCMDLRGLTEAEIVAGARRSTMYELAAMTLEADKVVVF
jgi:uncharacterized protein involved in oxidation of intracellular sulfur